MSNLTQTAMGFAKEIFTSLDMHWLGNGKGIWRPGYSAEEAQGTQIIVDAAHGLGMKGYRDLAGATYLVYSGKNPDLPVFMAGSHLDGVLNGGNGAGRWDGPVGVVSALSGVKMLKDKNTIPEHDTIVSIFPSEESAAFGKSLLGSSLSCGTVDSSSLDLKRMDTEKTLSAHMTALGLNPRALKEKLEDGKSSLPVEKIGSFIETHIEQGYTLQQSNTDIGIITAIRGTTRCPGNIVFSGEAGHTGGVPQADRREAASGASRLQIAIEDRLRKSGQEHDFTWSIKTQTPNASMTTISQQSEVIFDIRSLDQDALQFAKGYIKNYAGKIARKEGLLLGDSINNIVISNPVALSRPLAEHVSQIAKKMGISNVLMPSGAGHDAVTLAKCSVPTSMIFVAHGENGLSHDPLESLALTPDGKPFGLKGAFCKATQLNAAMMREPTIRPKRVQGLSFIDELQERGACEL